MPLAALQASLEASKATREEERPGRSERRNANDHVNGQASAFIQNGPHSHLTNGYSRQNSGESPRTIDSPFGVTSTADLNRSESKKLGRRPSIKHSQSGYKLERKVSFHDHTQIIGDDERGVDEDGVPLPDKPKRKRTEAEKEARRKEKEEKRERKEAKRAARGQSKDRKCKSEGDAVLPPPPQPVAPKQTVQGPELLEQVSQRLAEVERQQQRKTESSSLAPLPSSSLFQQDSQASRPANPRASEASSHNQEPPTSTTNLHNGHGASGDNKLTQSSSESTRGRKISKGPAPQPPVVDDLVNLEEEEAMGLVTLREHGDGQRDSKACSKRNSLDNKSVQTLAKDLAAECAKAYELMESSLSKLTNDFSIGPFGLTPKNKVGFAW